MIAILEYGMGNIRSIVNAVRAVGGQPFVAADPEDLRRADRLILPGVGTFGDGISNLRSRGWVQALNDTVRVQGKPFLGICLGMQLLASNGTEHGFHHGLDWLPGTVDRIQGGTELRIPHIGWNDVRFESTDGLYAELGCQQAFYFVHSFVLIPSEMKVVSGMCNYGKPFVASIEMGNVWGTQFHPEKSHRAGLAVLRNFLTKRF